MARATAEKKAEALKAQGLSFSERIEALLPRNFEEQQPDTQWPDPSLWRDPAQFCVKHLGFRPWKKQIEIMEAVRDHDRVAVATSHKIGKSAIGACEALAHYSCVPGSRVIMTSSIARQVQGILWREMRARWRTAKLGQCIHCVKLAQYTKRDVTCSHSSPLEGEFSHVAGTGLQADDLREVVGFTAQDAEGAAGISAPNVFYICDEASGIPSTMFAAIEGNRAGGAKLLLLGNPTRNDGEFYEAHHTKNYYRITVSAYDTPNAQCGYKLIEGLATREWIEEKLEDWGEDSPDFLIRALGKFAKGEQGCTMSLEVIAQAQERWTETPAEGRLYIGVDVAGAGEQGDETVIARRRGKKCYGLTAYRGLTEEGILANILGFIDTDALSEIEIPVVVVDVEGDIGSKVGKVIEAHLSLHPGAFLFVPVRASHNAIKQPTIYDKIRDDLWANMVRWVRDGGAIPDDNKLSQELHLPWWEMSKYNAKMKLIDKKTIRKRLKRSPDRAEALELCCWEPSNIEDRAAEAVKEKVGIVDAKPKQESNLGYQRPKTANPYTMLDRWQR